MTPLLQLIGAGLAYEGRQVLHDVSLRIDAHERVALIGPNGSGKSSLLRLIHGLVPPKAGCHDGAIAAPFA